MVDIVIGVVLCMTTFVVLLSMSLSISELVISQQYYDGKDCNNNRLMSPVLWLRIDGIVGLVDGVVLWMAVISLLICESACLFGTLVCTMFLTVGFQFAWTIVGAVMLWRDNESCSPEPLHDMLWAAIIIHLVLWGKICLVSGGKRN